ncbi:hypothetical protein BS17DRAFT_770467 [Gyrodon lividus]|nr:hypothetical protein BS17DRAFT_770467 [Gyrodon lividus]
MSTTINPPSKFPAPQLWRDFLNSIPSQEQLDGITANARIQRYLDKRDATSTSNLQKHSKKCWGTEVVAAMDGAKDADEVRTKIVGGSLHNGTIMVLFEQQERER